MSIGFLARRRWLVASFMVMGVVCSTVVDADDIRILLVPSRDPSVQAQVAKLERAIDESHGPLTCAESLSAAHVAIQFTGYRRTTGDKGEALIQWAGAAKLLKQPEEMTVSSTPLPERFGLLVIGEDGTAQRALKALEVMLGKTLRLPPRPSAKDAI
jgi:hypothetical protein